jgi:hypothetical protein
MCNCTYKLKQKHVTTLRNTEINNYGSLISKGNTQSLKEKILWLCLDIYWSTHQGQSNSDIINRTKRNITWQAPVHALLAIAFVLGKMKTLYIQQALRLKSSWMSWTYAKNWLHYQVGVGPPASIDRKEISLKNCKDIKTITLLLK